jgi:HEPN domain-containing protein
MQDPLHIFAQAKSFAKAAGVLSKVEDPAIMVDMAGPSLTLAAFASELYLKCLLVLQGSRPPNIHDLKKLFDRIEPEMQQTIERIWDTHVQIKQQYWEKVRAYIKKPFSLDLRSALEQGGRGFEVIRYSYEQSQEDFGFVLSDLPRVLQIAILEIKPEWARVRRKYEELPPLKNVGQ